MRRLQYFDESLAANEFEIALPHSLRDLLLEPDAPRVSEATISQIDAIHKLMMLEDTFVHDLRANGLHRRPKHRRRYIQAVQAGKPLTVLEFVPDRS